MDTLPDPFLFALFEGLPRKGPGSAASTERAYRCIDRHLHLPLILDIGCGSGASARELARLSHGEVVAVDLHRPFLRELRAAAAAGDTGRRITPCRPPWTGSPSGRAPLTQSGVRVPFLSWGFGRDSAPEGRS